MSSLIPLPTNDHPFFTPGTTIPPPGPHPPPVGPAVSPQCRDNATAPRTLVIPNPPPMTSPLLHHHHTTLPPGTPDCRSRSALPRPAEQPNPPRPRPKAAGGVPDTVVFASPEPPNVTSRTLSAPGTTTAPALFHDYDALFPPTSSTTLPYNRSHGLDTLCLSRSRCAFRHPHPRLPNPKP